MAVNQKELSDKQIVKIIQKGTESNKQAYAFLIPWLIGFIVFTVGPFFYTIYLSFYDVTQTGLGWVRTPVGLNNYVVAFFENTSFIPALLEFIILELTYVPTIIIISFILGILLNRNIKFRSGFRTIFFLPVIVLSGSVMDQLMSSNANQLTDLSNNIIFTMVHNFSPFLEDIMLTLFTNFTMVLWFTGIPIILFINGLQKINKSLFEAAKIDGATSWQILWKITVPIIRPTALVATIFTIVQIGMYNLNPVYGLIRDSMYNFAAGLGLASAYTWIYTFVVIIFVAVAMLILGQRDKQKEIKLTSLQRQKYLQMLQPNTSKKEVEVHE